MCINSSEFPVKKHLFFTGSLLVTVDAEDIDVTSPNNIVTYSILSKHKYLILNRKKIQTVHNSAIYQSLCFLAFTIYHTDGTSVNLKSFW